MKKFSAILASVVLMTLGSSGFAGQGHYIGTDANWFNPQNWSNGRVPDAKTHALISGRVHVVMDPALESAEEPPGRRTPFKWAGITLKNGAVLETLEGMTYSCGREMIESGAQLIHRGTQASQDGGILIMRADAGLRLNPTPKTKRDIVMQSTVVATFGIGGTTPASPAAAGRGCYATLTGDNITVGGDLAVELHYGFVPEPGQSFTIVKASKSLKGSYRGLREGSLVARFGDVGLFLTYGRDPSGRICEHVLVARQI